MCPCCDSSPYAWSSPGARNLRHPTSSLHASLWEDRAKSGVCTKKRSEDKPQEVPKPSAWRGLRSRNSHVLQHPSSPAPPPSVSCLNARSEVEKATKPRGKRDVSAENGVYFNPCGWVAAESSWVGRGDAFPGMDGAVLTPQAAPAHAAAAGGVLDAATTTPPRVWEAPVEVLRGWRRPQRPGKRSETWHPCLVSAGGSLSQLKLLLSGCFIFK